MLSAERPGVAGTHSAGPGKGRCTARGKATWEGAHPRSALVACGVQFPISSAMSRICRDQQSQTQTTSPSLLKPRRETTASARRPDSWPALASATGGTHLRAERDRPNPSPPGAVKGQGRDNVGPLGTPLPDWPPKPSSVSKMARGLKKQFHHLLLRNHL